MILFKVLKYVQLGPICHFQLTVKASVLNLILSTCDLCLRNHCSHYGSLQNFLLPPGAISLLLTIL